MFQRQTPAAVVAAHMADEAGDGADIAAERREPDRGKRGSHALAALVDRLVG